MNKRMAIISLIVLAFVLGCFLAFGVHIKSKPELELRKESATQHQENRGTVFNAHGTPLALASIATRHDVGSTKPLPSENTKWHLLYEELAGRAASGDAAAAIRLYEDTNHCISYLSTKIAVNSYLNASDAVASMSEDKSNSYANRLARFEGTIDKYAGMCASFTASEMADKIYSILKYAALAGNESAAACYVIAAYPVNDDWQENDAMIAEYRSNALMFVRRGIKNGDWRMIEAMADAYGGGITPPTWQSHLVKPDALTFYAYLKIEELGSDIDSIDAISSRLEAVKRENNFSALEVASADAWAKDMYSRYFAKKTAYSGASGYCGESDTGVVH